MRLICLLWQNQFPLGEITLELEKRGKGEGGKKEKKEDI